MYFFCFSNHNVALNIISELKGDKEKKGNNAINIQFYIEFILYLVVMFAGYLSTFNYTSEIYIDRPGEGMLIIIGEALYMIGLTCNIGLYYYISRPQIEMLYFHDMVNHFGDFT
jgi:amino acid permease